MLSSNCVILLDKSWRAVTVQSTQFRVSIYTEVQCAVAGVTKLLLYTNFFIMQVDTDDGTSL